MRATRRGQRQNERVTLWPSYATSETQRADRGAKPAGAIVHEDQRETTSLYVTVDHGAVEYCFGHSALNSASTIDRLRTCRALAR